MKDNRAIRSEARQLLHTRWFARLSMVGVTLQLIAVGVMQMLGGTYKAMNITTFGDLLEAKLKAAQAGLGYTLPSVAAGWNMTGATVFENFIRLVFAAIFALGVAKVSIKAVRDNQERWFADGFIGYSRPLESAWLYVLLNLRIVLWSLLFIVPGVIAVYRYRQAWYVKCEHPEYSAGQCLRESSKMMDGHKWDAFSLDCSFWLWMLLLWLSCGAAIVCGAMAGESVVLGMVAAVFGLVAAYVVIYAMVYYFLARTIFYRELVDEVKK